MGLTSAFIARTRARRSQQASNQAVWSGRELSAALLSYGQAASNFRVQQAFQDAHQCPTRIDRRRVSVLRLVVVDGRLDRRQVGRCVGSEDRFHGGGRQGARQFSLPSGGNLKGY